MKVLEYTEDRILTEGAGIPSIELSEIIILVGVGFFFFGTTVGGSSMLL